MPAAHHGGLGLVSWRGVGGVGQVCLLCQGVLKLLLFFFRPLSDLAFVNRLVVRVRQASISSSGRSQQVNSCFLHRVVSRSTAGCYADQRTFDPTQGWCLAPQRAVTLTSGLLTLPRDAGQIKLFDFLVKSKDLSSAPRMVPLSVDLDPPRRG